MTAIAPPDLAMGNLLDAEAATITFTDLGLPITIATPNYVRHKQGESTIIAYRFDVSGGGITHGYAHWCARPERADDVFAKAISLRPRDTVLGSGVLRVDKHTVLYALPNDARLRQLRWFTDPRKLKRSMATLAAPGERISARASESEILRYKPERRVVCRVSIGNAQGDTQDVLVRYTTKPHASKLHRVVDLLRERGVAAPAPRAMLEDGRVSIDEFIPGVVLREAIDRRDVEPAAVADAVLRLHHVFASNDERAGLAAGLDTRTADDELERIRRGLDGLSSLRPQLAGLSGLVAAALTRTVPDGVAPNTGYAVLHGDLHSKNVMVNEGAVTAIDLERVAFGPAEIDLGFFRAHALARPIRAGVSSFGCGPFTDDVIDAYCSNGGRLAAAPLAWHTAVGLIDQALLTVRHLEPNADRKGSDLLARALSLLLTKTEKRNR